MCELPDPSTFQLHDAGRQRWVYDVLEHAAKGASDGAGEEGLIFFRRHETRSGQGSGRSGEPTEIGRLLRLMD